MKLHRFITVVFDPLEEDVPGWVMTIHGVSVRTRQMWKKGKKRRYLVSASVSLPELPKKDEHGLICVQSEWRAACEYVLECSANIVAVNYCCKRTISSPMPCVTLEAEDGSETEHLESSNGLRLNKAALFPPIIKTDILECPNFLKDRLDGVSLMAEAVSHEHATGQFHEFMRLFERAFACGPHSLIKPLSSFLANTHFGYDHEEIAHWFDGLRHPATHADRRAVFLTEAQIRPYIHRIHQAAYDVLYNKAEWRSKSSERRTAWRPCAGTSDANGAMFMINRSEFNLNVQFLDDYGIYPRDLNAVLNSLPSGHWAKDPDTREKPKAGDAIKTVSFDGSPDISMTLEKKRRGTQSP